MLWINYTLVMDRKTFSTKFVDKSWVFPHLDKIKGMIRQKIGETEKLTIQTKLDQSVVTDIDHFISDLVKKTFIAELEDVNYFSEEDQETFQFPMIILDPIDGTKELVAGIGEYAVSFGIYFSKHLDDPRNFSWIYNPFNGMEITSETPMLPSARDYQLGSLSVAVSRSEFKNNLFSEQDRVQIKPVGSIANKLMLLSYDLTDAVISKRPKNIWDIMAGTHIAHKRGIRLWINGKIIDELDQITYAPTFVWSKLDPEKFQI